jgi:tRNA-dihydrouridine synthase
VERHADLEALRRETGCAFAMVGRGALADPWIFSGHEASGAEAAGFLLAYGQGLEAQGASARGAAARVKQLLGHWRAGGLVPDEEARRRWLRERDPRALFARLEAWVPQGARGAD